MVWCKKDCSLQACAPSSHEPPLPHTLPNYIRECIQLLTRSKRLVYAALYTLFAFLTVQVGYRPLLWTMEDLGLNLGGWEVTTLDTVWITLLGLEALMVGGVVVVRLRDALGGASMTKGKLKEL
jgi:hypothetical protein